MDQENLKNVLALAKNEGQKAKVSLLLGDEAVPDPYWDNQLFEPVYQMIEQACQRIILEEGF
jgi:protein-tyrosine phosphatase